MNLYDRFVLPRAVELVCSGRSQARQRARVVPAARGVVLEIGFGTGLNLGHYDPARVERILAIDPADEMWRLAERRVAASPIPVERLAMRADRIRLAAGSVDSAVVTYSLCTIPDVVAALAAVRDALRPGGRLHFCEHGAAPDPAVLRWQNRLDGIWGIFSGGCHLNRPIPRLIAAAGFHTLEIQAGYLPGWRPGSFNYWGQAEPR